MEDIVFDKTLKGRCEIANREFGLPARLHTLLLLVDGRKTAADILRLVAGFGLGRAHLEQLRNAGFIREAALLGRPTARQQAEPRFRSLYEFYTDTIQRHLGLRGHALQLRVEQAGTFAALAALREPYLQALLAARGNDVARAVQRRLDTLLARDELTA